jgi:hypothetical protein
MGLDMYLFVGKTDGDGPEIGYWRKANGIHKWFIDKLNDGRDVSCEVIPVSLSNLKELQVDVNQALANKSLAPKLIPTGAGFFFGSTEYDEYYYEDLQDTLKIIDKAIETGEEDFCYMAWW